MHLELTTLVVDDYDAAIRFFVDVLGFELAEDSPSLTNDGRAKRWVVVRPPGAATGLLLALADGERQRAAVGEQYSGRVGLFLRVDDFDARYERMVEARVEFVTEPRTEDYGRVVVFRDPFGNKWDLLGPESGDAEASLEPSAAVVVRRERPEDQAAVRSVQIAAFDQGQGEPIEAALLDGLRVDGWIRELSLVAELDGTIVGHNVCTRGSVDGVRCLGLGPIGVDPSHQQAGVGSAMMWAMIGAADALGEPLIALLGAPSYYSRFGFRASSELGIEPPDPAWGSYFQALPLTAWSSSLTGQFTYAAPFSQLD